MSDDGRVVVITGASGGVGRAITRSFAKEGAKIALLARGEEGLEGAAEEVRAAGSTPLEIPTDVADPDAVEEAAERVSTELGPIDVWINDAFTSVFAPVHEIEPAEFRRVTEVSYLGTVYGTLSALRRMRARGSGTIVQVGSALAYRGIPLQAAYSAAKHAIQGFTEALRCELLHENSGVHITMVQLPGLNTPQFDWLLSRLSKPAQPVAPIYQPEVAARAVHYAANHPQRREYWAGESTVGVMIGDKLFPGLLDRYLARTAFAGQQSNRAEPSRDPNLWRPADDAGGTDAGAHGSFDASSHSASPQLWASHHHGLLGATAAASAALLALTLGKKRNR